MRTTAASSGWQRGLHWPSFAWWGLERPGSWPGRDPGGSSYVDDHRSCATWAPVMREVGRLGREGHGVAALLGFLPEANMFRCGEAAFPLMVDLRMPAAAGPPSGGAPAAVPGMPPGVPGAAGAPAPPGAGIPAYPLPGAEATELGCGGAPRGLEDGVMLELPIAFRKDIKTGRSRSSSAHKKKRGTKKSDRTSSSSMSASSHANKKESRRSSKKRNTLGSKKSSSRSSSRLRFLLLFRSLV